jgi:plasmid stability protein
MLPWPSVRRETPAPALSWGKGCYDGTIMMARTQITLPPEVQRRARQRATDLGCSLAEYVRRLVTRDLGGEPVRADPALVFDLGSSGGSDIARHKHAMIAQAMAAARPGKRHNLKKRG